MHRSGRKHGNADALSRMPCKQCGRVTLEETEQEILIIGLQTSTEQLRDSQLADPIIGPVLQAVEKKDRPSPDASRSQPPMIRRLFQQWDQLKIKEGTLWRLFESEDDTSHHLQLIVPTSLREDILQELHAGVSGTPTHLGQEKTMAQLREHFYWSGQWRDVSNWCRTCSTCATRKTLVPKLRAPLGNIQAGYPMQILAVDILGPLPRSEAGNSYILVVGDYFTRWIEAYPIPNQEAVTVAVVLVDQWFCRFSVPEQLHSVQGRQFESELMGEV